MPFLQVRVPQAKVRFGKPAATPKNVRNHLASGAVLELKGGFEN